MNKVLWLVNPLLVTELEIDFPKYIQELTQCNLLCILLENNFYETLPMYTGDPMFPAVDFSMINSTLNEEAMQKSEQAKQVFIELCTKKGLQFSIHNDKGNPVSEVVKESRFADLILVKNSLSFNAAFEEVSGNFVKKVLGKSECPVLVVPDDHQVFNEIYFTYNGGYSSVYAIRQFTYLFPQLKDIPVTVLFVDEKNSDIPIIHEKEIKELLHAHYTNFSFKILRGDVETELLVEMLPKKNVLVTYGAFGRNNISRMFKRGSADKVLEMIDIPLFITHP